MQRPLVCLFAAAACSAFGATAEDQAVLVDRVGDTGFIQLRAESFRAMSPRQQELAYWLSQAAIAIDPIFYDQMSFAGLREKRLLEEIVAHAGALEPELRGKVTDFAKRFWANRGNHQPMTAQKFLPGFTPEELHRAALAAQRDGAFRTACGDLPPLATAADLEEELTGLRPALFDPAFEPTTTARSPEPGKDLVQSSSNTFYSGVTQAEMAKFPARYSLNSRVVKGTDGQIRELVYRAGTPDGKVPAGLYAGYLDRAISYLERAQAVAEPDQAAVLGALIKYFQTGEFSDLLAFDAGWVQNDAPVDFANWFIEVYHDAINAKGSAQAFVSVTDVPVTQAMTKLAANAPYFEEKAPWDARYKKAFFRKPTVKAVETVIETGDFMVITIGDNLPNENEVREKYGSKNFLFTASSRALKAAVGQKCNVEFYASPEMAARQAQYGDAADELLTALHEVIGHGSGKLSEQLAGGAQPHLKEYYSTLEEARADLMALWNVWDPKLKELGLVTEQEEIAKAMYDRAALNVLVQLRSIPHGDTIVEDHQRNRALIDNYIMDRSGAIEMFNRDGKTYVRVTDYPRMRAAVGELLAELMRIKAEGDYAAIKALVDKYGSHFDPAVRDQVIARYRKLDLPTYWAGINPELTATLGADGRPVRVDLAYPADTVHQYLHYGAMYNPGLNGH